jgi:prepilin-type N-terminal cleavage/methylation domain-containing protein
MLKKRFQSGLSMIEVLTVTAIIGILAIIALTTLPKQINKGRDGRRKSDLQKIKIAFENYYSDNDCYPPPEILDNCASNDLAPYMAAIPCDPLDNSKYLYAPLGGSCSSSYRVFTNLEVDTDPVIEELGCHTDVGCGAFAYFEDELGLLAVEYNYGISEGIQLYVTDGGAPEGTRGFCCQNINDYCDTWTYGRGECQDFYFDNDECDLACNAPTR